VDDSFVAEAVALIAPDTEYLIAGLEPKRYGVASWLNFSAGVGPAELKEDLANDLGELVAIGAYPPWLEDNEDVHSGIVPDPDGSVVAGAY
jgi:hypothetical protein